MITIRIDKSKKVNGDWALYVSFPYDNKIVTTIREFPSRYWNKEEKEWELPFNKLGDLINKLPEYKFDILGEYVTLEKPKAEIPEGFEFKTKPFQHQIESFNFGLTHNKWFLGDEMGCGKTKESIDLAIAMKLQKGYKHCLVICGVNSLKWNWVNEIHTHSDEDAWILGQRWKGRSSNSNSLFGGQVNGSWKIGSTTDKLNDLQSLNNKPYFLITNVETLRNTDIVSILSELTKNGTIGMCIADEVHVMRNPSSQQGKGFLKINTEYKLAMTGTPLMNNSMDLYVILKWLGYEKHTKYAFQNHYCIMGGFGGHEVTGYKNLEELQERLNEIMLRRKKEEILDLPEKTYIDEYVEMTAKQEQIYKEVTMEIKSNIDNIKMANNPLAELIRMRQATGYTGILSSTIQESAKIDRMKELVEEAVSNGKKVVIFSNWTQITNVIYDRLHFKYGARLITGETPDTDRINFVKAFQEKTENKVLIGTIGAMGTGLTLTAGTVEIFMDEPWTMAAKRQAEDRCHRVGTTENVTIYTIMCKDTIDERIHDIVEKKGALADAIVDGKVNIDKRQLLEYLIG